MSSFNPTTGDLVLTRTDRVARLLSKNREDGVWFAVIKYLDGQPADYPLSGDPTDDIGEHRVKTGKVVRAGGDYHNEADWVSERGLRRVPESKMPNTPNTPNEEPTMATTTTTTTITATKMPASQVKVGDVIGTAQSNTRKTIESGQGYTVADLTRDKDSGKRIQARDQAGKVIRSMQSDTQVWVGRAGEDTPAETPEPAKPARKRATKPAAPKPATFEWPTDPGKLLKEYLASQVTDAADAPNRAKPFIDQRGILRLHSSDWMSWLEAKGINAPKGAAAAPLRDAGLGVRTFNLPGEDRALGFYTGPAPKGTEKLPRRAPARAARAPRNPFAALTEDQRTELASALVERPEGALRTELLELITGAGR